MSISMTSSGRGLEFLGAQAHVALALAVEGAQFGEERLAVLEELFRGGFAEGAEEIADVPDEAGDLGTGLGGHD